MKNRVKKLLDDLLEKKHFKYRQPIDNSELTAFTKSLSEQSLSDMRRATSRLSWVLAHEKPVILPGERIVFTRTVQHLPEIFTQKEWSKIKTEHYIHELGRVCNINSDFGYTIEAGLEQRKEEILHTLQVQKEKGNSEGIEFLEAVLQSIHDIEKLCDRYALEALKLDREDVYSVLQNIPRTGAKTFYEALQFFRILHFTLWASGNYHNTIGRFDQYMFKYLERDLSEGRLDSETALELLEEFFITLNKDSDLYVGMQKGDNGQSMVLGGVEAEGQDAYNALSELCLKASLELSLIDPKINLRVNKSTPLSIYELGSELTKQGLGFPQYSNDDIVIPGLVSKGYSLEDARNYVVAACWEFIIPGKGMDIPNITALSFVKVVNKAIKKHLQKCQSFRTFLLALKGEIREELSSLTSHLYNIYFEPAPFQSLLMDSCIENVRDISFGNKYNNYGIHGTGLSTAVDSLAAIKKYVFEEKLFDAENLINAVDSDYVGYNDIYTKLKYEAPKMGKDDDYADNIAVVLLDYFSELTEELKNEKGGCYRPGTGSAMYYLWHADEIGASADGRKKGEPLSANFSPSLNIKLDGPVSIIKSFSKPDMKKIMNGGPLTLELHDSVFRNKDSIKKVASLVKSFMDLGGQQLQINAINREQLLEAKKHPEKYKNLIVRVWGWSGYFVELDELYQDHIIKRVELNVQ